MHPETNCLFSSLVIVNLSINKQNKKIKVNDKR